MAGVPFVLLQVVLVPLLASVVCLAAGGQAGRRVGWVAFAALAYVALLLASVELGLSGGGGPAAETYTWAPGAGLSFGFLGDGLSTPVALVMSLVCAATAVYSMPYLKRRFEDLYGEKKNRQYGVYYLSFLLVASGLFGVSLSTNLIELFLFVELMLLPTFLVLSLFGYFQRGRIAIMYFVWNQLGALIFLVGVLAAYSATGKFDVPSLAALGAGSTIATAVFLLVTVGWFVKMGVIGVHMWLPYSEAEPPTCFAPIMATVVAVGNYVMVRLLVQYMPAVFATFSVPFMVVALLTMIFGGAMTLVQDDVKYLFAWSTVSQNAYSLLGIGSLTLLGVSGGIFYSLSHILGKTILFSAAGILLTSTGIRDIRQMGGLASKMPLTATLFLIGGLILSAVPPTSGFQAEWIMFTGIFFQGAYGVTINLVIAILGIVATFFTMAYTFWPVRRIFFGILPTSLQSVTDAPLAMTVPLLALAAISILLGIYPDLISKMLVGFAGSLSALKAGV